MFIVCQLASSQWYLLRHIRHIVAAYTTFITLDVSFFRSPNLGPMKHPYLMVLQYSQDGMMLNITKLKLLSQFTEWKYSVWSSHMTLEGLFCCMFCISVVFD